VALNQEGEYIPVTWEPFEVAKRIVQVVRECAAKKLGGEPLV
jgi:hypothetical protein